LYLQPFVENASQASQHLIAVSCRSLTLGRSNEDSFRAHLAMFSD